MFWTHGKLTRSAIALLGIALILAVSTQAMAHASPTSDATRSAGHDHGSDEVAAGELPITAADYSYGLPGAVEAGLVTVSLENEGKENHHAQIARLADGTTLTDLEAALPIGPEAIGPLLTFVRGPGITAPGQRSETVIDLQPGLHVVLCFVESPDNLLHLAKGMIHPLEVVPPAAEPSASEPSATATITMRDFAFAMPLAIGAGKQTWKIVNDGAQPHELQVFKLGPGTTPADVAAGAIVGTPADYTPVGGMQALASGLSGWMTLDLGPGEYVAICFIPDPTSGHRHHELSMVVSFTVES